MQLRSNHNKNSGNDKTAASLINKDSDRLQNIPDRKEVKHEKTGSKEKGTDSAHIISIEIMKVIESNSKGKGKGQQKGLELMKAL